MIRLTLQILIGIALSGCTVNNFHSTVTTNYDHYSTEYLTSVDMTQGLQDRSESPTKHTQATAEGNLKIKPDCEIYVPLPVPKPVKVDFKELELAESSKEINAIALRNVRELHLQINSYAVNQQRHYNEYLQRCAVK